MCSQKEPLPAAPATATHEHPGDPPYSMCPLQDLQAGSQDSSLPEALSTHSTSLPGCCPSLMACLTMILLLHQSVFL